jgi:hypothetical protein
MADSASPCSSPSPRVGGGRLVCDPSPTPPRSREGEAAPPDHPPLAQGERGRGRIARATRACAALRPQPPHPARAVLPEQLEYQAASPRQRAPERPQTPGYCSRDERPPAWPPAARARRRQSDHRRPVIARGTKGHLPGLLQPAPAGARATTDARLLLEGRNHLPGLLQPQRRPQRFDSPPSRAYHNSNPTHL